LLSGFPFALIQLLLFGFAFLAQFFLLSFQFFLFLLVLFRYSLEFCTLLLQRCFSCFEFLRPLGSLLSCSPFLFFEGLFGVHHSFGCFLVRRHLVPDAFLRRFEVSFDVRDGVVELFDVGFRVRREVCVDFLRVEFSQPCCRAGEVSQVFFECVLVSGYDLLVHVVFYEFDRFEEVVDRLGALAVRQPEGSFEEFFHFFAGLLVRRRVVEGFHALRVVCLEFCEVVVRLVRGLHGLGACGGLRQSWL